MAQETVVVRAEVQGGESVGSLKKQLREAQKEVEVLSEKFGATSEQAVAAAKKAAELKDAIGDARALTDAFNPDRKFQAFASALQGVVGGISAFQGAMGLLGVENENVEKTLLKVQSAMALSQGLNSVLESRDAFKNLNTVIQSTTVFQKANTAATVAATTVQKLFGASVVGTGRAFAILKGAIAATGIGLLIVGVGALISKISDWTSSTNTSKAAQDRLNRALEQQQALFARQKEDLGRQREIAVKRAQLANASADEIFKINQQFNAKDRDATAKNYNTILGDLKKFEKERLTINSKGNLEGTEKDIEFYNEKRKALEQAGAELRSVDFKNQTDQLDNQIRINEERKKNDEEAASKRKQDADKAAQESKAKREKAKQEREQEAKEIEDARKESAKRITELEDEIFLQSLKDDFQRSLAKLSQDKEKQINEINATKANTEQKQKEIALVEQKFAQDKAKIEEEEKKKREEKEKEDSEKAAAKLKERLDLENSIRIAAIKDEFERKKSELLLQEETEKTDLEKKRTDGLISEEAYQQALLNIKTKYEDLNTKNEKDQAEAREKIAEKERQVRIDNAQKVAGVLSGLSELFGKETAAGKATAIAAATINTYLAASQALTGIKKLNPLGATIAIAQAGLIIANGIKQVREIAKVKVPGGAGGSVPSAASLSAGGSAPITPQSPQAQLTQLDQATINSLGSATNRAYVVETDITNSQERISRINRAARLN